MVLDLRIDGAVLAGREGRWAIAIQNNTITHVAPTLAIPAKQTINAGGKLVIPGLVDPHLHLDKALLLEQHPAQKGNFQEALEETFNLKRNFTIEDIQTRASSVLESEIGFGTTAIRSHVEVDPVLQLTSM
ncbi:MAG: amidohydrolase family protein, partial [Phormidesmis sp.]